MYTIYWAFLECFLSAGDSDPFCTPAAVSFWEGLKTLCQQGMNLSSELMEGSGKNGDVQARIVGYDAFI